MCPGGVGLFKVQTIPFIALTKKNEDKEIEEDQNALALQLDRKASLRRTRISINNRKDSLKNEKIRCKMQLFVADKPRKLERLKEE